MKHEELAAHRDRVVKANKIEAAIDKTRNEIFNLRDAHSYVLDWYINDGHTLTIDGNACLILTVDEIKQCRAYLRDMLTANLEEKLASLRKEFEEI